MGLPAGWVTDAHELTQNQELTALGNGVLTLQAARALELLSGHSDDRCRSLAVRP